MPLQGFYRTKFTDGSIEKHCHKIAMLLAQLNKTPNEMVLSDSHKSPLLLASIGIGSEYETTAAALRTKNVDEISFDYVSTTLIEEYRARSTRKKINTRKKLPSNNKNNKDRDKHQLITTLNLVM